MNQPTNYICVLRTLAHCVLLICFIDFLCYTEIYMFYGVVSPLFNRSSHVHKHHCVFIECLLFCYLKYVQQLDKY